MHPAEKLRFAHQLAELGVDIIEAGFPIASKGDFESVRTIAAEVEGAPDRRARAREAGRHRNSGGARLRRQRSLLASTRFFRPPTFTWNTR